MHADSRPRLADLRHPVVSRRFAVQAGAIGLLGLGHENLGQLRAAAPQGAARANPKARAAIYIFLSGGLAQHDSFDLKPDAAEGIRGEFKPIATSTPGLQICEHLPKLAKRSHLWALVRSLTHPSNDHSAGHLFMLTGRRTAPAGFDPSMPKSTDWPSIASVAGALMPARNNLPPAIVLPDRLVHYSGRVIPGQFAGQMGRRRDPWFIECAAYDPLAYGAFPTYEFDHQRRERKAHRFKFQTPSLTLPEEFGPSRMNRRVDLVRHIDRQRSDLDRFANISVFDQYRQSAVALLTDAKIRKAVDLAGAHPKDLERYGQHSFGWSLFMAKRLVEAGVSLVQVNLGNNETWDTHGFAFPHLKDKLFPPTDQALSALLDDLQASGLLDSTMIVMAGEFGRTPKVSTLPQFYALPGRDHWGAVQTVFFAGGGVRGGAVVGSSDKIGAFPATDPQYPENMAATIYRSLGLPPTASWRDEQDRPHFIYNGEPIKGLL